MKKGWDWIWKIITKMLGENSCKEIRMINNTFENQSSSIIDFNERIALSLISINTEFRELLEKACDKKIGKIEMNEKNLLVNKLNRKEENFRRPDEVNIFNKKFNRIEKVRKEDNKSKISIQTFKTLKPASMKEGCYKGNQAYICNYCFRWTENGTDCGPRCKNRNDLWTK